MPSGLRATPPSPSRRGGRQARGGACAAARPGRFGRVERMQIAPSANDSGHSGFPLRLGVPAEESVVRMHLVG